MALLSFLLWLCFVFATDVWALFASCAAAFDMPICAPVLSGAPMGLISRN